MYSTKSEATEVLRKAWEAPRIVLERSLLVSAQEGDTDAIRRSQAHRVVRKGSWDRWKTLRASAESVDGRDVRTRCHVLAAPCTEAI